MSATVRTLTVALAARIIEPSRRPRAELLDELEQLYASHLPQLVAAHQPMAEALAVLWRRRQPAPDHQLATVHQIGGRDATER